MFIYKIPIYVEVKVEGDFNPNDLSKAIDLFVAERVQKCVKEYGGFPHSNTDILDTTADNVRKAIKAKSVRLSLITKSQAFKRINEKD
jgi:hypothetical protein